VGGVFDFGDESLVVYSEAGEVAAVFVAGFGAAVYSVVC
jgi:hypothetical protein